MSRALRHDLPSDCRLSDGQTFLSVERHQSITKASRELGVTPSQVSKALSRLERSLGVRLFVRTSQGVATTAAGHRLHRVFLRLFDELDRLSKEPHGVQQHTVGIASPSYLSTTLVAQLITAAPEIRVRNFEIGNQRMRALAGSDLFDLALTDSPEPFPPLWQTERLGQMRLGLFGSPSLFQRLGGKPVTEKALRPIPFLLPIQLVDGAPVPSDDGCPLNVRDRLAGHEIQTMGVGIELAAQTEQLLFGPALLVVPALQQHRLVEIPVMEWDVRREVFLAFHIERTTQPRKERIKSALAAFLGLSPTGEKPHPRGRKPGRRTRP